jgi:hypothetical protein
MEKKTAKLVGALAGLASMGTAQAAIHSDPSPAQASQVSSYAELLKPIPNALELLKASNAQLLQQKAEARPGVELAQYNNFAPPPPAYHHHHHHHHHHAYYPPPPPHHHHHHHNGVTVLVPGVGVLHSGN